MHNLIDKVLGGHLKRFEDIRYRYAKLVSWVSLQESGLV